MEKEVKSHSVKKNFIYNFAYQVLTIIVPIVTVPYVARVLGPEGLGIYSYTGTYVSYFTMLAVLGLGSYGQWD